MDPDQTAPTGAVWSGSTLFIYEALNILMVDKKHTFCDYALKGLINVSSLCVQLGFHEMHARLRGQNNLFNIIHQIIHKT